ncbi:hypothetical protein COLO4_17234 [Corchorus olitorius]|uniref:Uncharacterized protein n=1 Tax=Corchorus olitorius TaxID=93759 RepID=A0A1R3JDH4_9ROSI|nr:hypothetical protein COLO4_17234 [Corchorus olitorius]
MTRGFQIKNMEGDHSCGVSFKNKQVKSKMIAKKLHETIRETTPR